MERWVWMTNITEKYGEIGRDDKYNGKVWTDGKG